ncbi:MAG: toll/interleukin-1 receptor domain-containing protein [Candidatus Bathyarchaeia archaeon]
METAGSKREFDVFVCHENTTGHHFALHLKKALEKLKVSAFVAPDDVPAGEKEREYRYSVLRKCEVVVFIVTNLALKSEEVKNEIEYALEKRKVILPCLESNVDAEEFRRHFSEVSERQQIRSFKDKEELADKVVNWFWKWGKPAPSVVSTPFGQVSLDGVARVEAFPKELREYVKELINHVVSAYPRGFSKKLAAKVLDVFKRQESLFYVEDVFSDFEVFKGDLEVLGGCLEELHKLSESDEKVLDLRCALAVGLARILPPKRALEVLKANKPVGKSPALVFEYRLSLAYAYYGLGKRKESLLELEEVLKIREVAENSVFRAQLLKASVLIELCVSAEAMKIVENILRDCVDLEIRMRAGFLHAYLLSKMGRYKDALGEYEELLKNKRVRDSLRLAICNNMGTIYIVFSDFGKAKEKLEMCLNLAKEGTSEMAAALGNIGLILADLGKPNEALEHHKKALAIDEEIGNKLGMAAALGNIGLILADLGKPNEALEHHKKALAIDEEIGNKLGMAADYRNISVILLSENQRDGAIQLLEKAAEIYSQTGLSNEEKKIKEIIAKLKSEKREA